ncbi:bile acid:sodium symporter [uncultured Pseudoteredinibacter sp.]|uniref:bile acid:sodium symporter family protein n=1 Tax=uncultured Pseudoteredinibacter sp. TaxID=1641701 RepID=UPI0026056FFF|nr:bile acid:sodium symporter [uncultured Pseudoteredinibacter sp.]
MGSLYIQYEYWFSAFQLITAMVGMGATLTPKDFKELMLEPKAVSSGTAIQILVVPAIAWLFISAFGLAGGVAVGLALIASVPGGSTSNIFTHFARGNIALSVAITAVTTLACLFTTPFILDLLIANYMPVEFVMPKAHIMKEIALTLLLPLALGMLYLKLFPSTAEQFSKWAIRASMFGLLMIVVGASASGRLDLQLFGYFNVFLIVFFILAMGVVSWLISWGLLRLSHADATAVDMEVVVRNINLGLMLKALLFPAVLGQVDPVGDMVLLALLLYGGLQMFVAAALIALRRSTAPASH